MADRRVQSGRGPLGRALTRWLGVGAAAVLALGIVLGPGPAFADGCGPLNPECGFGGGGGGKDPGTPSPGPIVEPPENSTEWKTRLTPGCGTEQTCLNTTCPDGTTMMSEETRKEVYRSATGWQPVAGPEGEWRANGVQCVAPGELGPSEEDVWRAVKRFGLPGGRTEIQPPNGRTLVNLRTNFYTTKGPDAFDLPVGPVTVQIEATPVSYAWNFGDGSEATTSTPGHKYPDLDVTHVYKTAGHYKPSVTIYYAIRWKHGSRDWAAFPQPLPATTSPTTDLEVVESRSVLGEG